jgi:triacylglycerol esterase/lipase EstA (alpha/beta hydrolase family)
MGGHVVEFDPMINYLREAGFNRSIYVITFGDNGSTSVEDDAKVIQEVVEDILIARPSVTLDFVGHSKGGVACHYLADKLAPDKPYMGKVISVSSPYLGSILTPIIGGKVDEDLGVESQVLKDLKEGHLKDNYYYIGNTLDHIVTDLSAIPEGVPAGRILRTRDHKGHAFITSQEVATQVFEWLSPPKNTEEAPTSDNN